MIRTFFDSGVLITATRFQSQDADRALKFLEDPNRIALTSPFVRLEVLPKAIFFKKHLERLFYDRISRAPSGSGKSTRLRPPRERKQQRRALERWTPSTWRQRTYPMLMS